MKNRRILFDIETDGLLHEATQIWIFHCVDLETSETFEWVLGDLGFKDFIEKEVKELVGHFILGFDIPVLEKLFEFKISLTDIKITDTLILSRVLNYNRFNNRHSLEVWGEALGQPKQEHDNWLEFSPEMVTRCRSDVALNANVLEVLQEEYLALFSKNPLVKQHLNVEHSVSWWCSQAELHGWPFDMEAARLLAPRLQEELDKAYNALNARLGMKAVAVDMSKGIVEEKRPKWIKNGFYDQHTCNWFNIEPPSGFEGEERLVEGPYCRVTFEKLSLDSVADVKIFLFRNGWEPTSWNFKKDPVTMSLTKTSPKITDDSLEFLGGDGRLYSNFAVARSRLAILNTWINVCKDGRVHGECNPIGTPSFRATHSVIVNVPSADTAWGPEMRSLFYAPKGYRLIGCDSASNQARGLAFFLKNPQFTDTLLNGDIHAFNARILDQVLKDMGFSWDSHIINAGKAIVSDEQRGVLSKEDFLRSNSELAQKALFAVKRAAAKRILYAFLFGASGGKLWLYITDILDSTKGNKLKAGFTAAVPGFKDLVDRLEKIYKSTSSKGKGYIPALSGAKLYVDSKHKLLVYLLQSTEKLTCGGAVHLLIRRLKEENIWFQPCIMMHDEVQFLVKEADAERAAVIGRECFRDGPKLFGIEIMDGGAKIGANWYETH